MCMCIHMYVNFDSELIGIQNVKIQKSIRLINTVSMILIDTVLHRTFVFHSFIENENMKSLNFK